MESYHHSSLHLIPYYPNSESISPEPIQLGDTMEMNSILDLRLRKCKSGSAC